MDLVSISKEKQSHVSQHLSCLKKSWGLYCLNSSAQINHSSMVSLIRNPLNAVHPVAQAISYLWSKSLGLETIPLEITFPSLNISSICELLLLYKIAGLDVDSLANQFFPLGAFSSLFTMDFEYEKKEFEKSFLLISKAFGVNFLNSYVEDPYIKAILKFLPQFKRFDVASDFAQIYQTADCTLVLSRFGLRVPSGLLHSESIQIPAFGPCIGPLNDTSCFGVHFPEVKSSWSFLHADPEVWCQVLQNDACFGFDVRLMGLVPEKNISFCFYVCADSAWIENTEFKPKSLLRYNGDAKLVSFEKSGRRFSIENKLGSKMELIPLAGEGCFWDASFLLSYEIATCVEKASFYFSSL